MGKTTVSRLLGCCCILLGLLLAVQAAYGQIRRNNFTRENSSFSPSGSNVRGMDMKKMEMAPGFDNTITLDKWNKRFSPLGQRRAPMQVEGSFDTKMIEPEMKEYEVIDREMSIWNEREAYFESWGRMMERDRVGKYEDAPVARVSREAPRFEDFGEQLDLQELNRFQFRSNRSDGLPVQRVGTGDLGEGEILPQNLGETEGGSIEDLLFGERRSGRSRDSLNLGDPGDFVGREGDSLTTRQLLGQGSGRGGDKPVRTQSSLPGAKPKLADPDAIPRSFRLPNDRTAADPFATGETKTVRDGSTTISVRVKD